MFPVQLLHLQWLDHTHLLLVLLALRSCKLLLGLHSRRLALIDCENIRLGLLVISVELVYIFEEAEL